MTVAEIAELIGSRVKQYRLNRDLTQEDLATLASLSLNAIKKAEAGKSTLETYVSIMKALDLTEQFLSAFPDYGVSPIQLLKAKDNQKKRASGKTVIQTLNEEELDW
ncbi:helix-turn-helix domain-containing protein [Glaciecola siphonariae]|uniref:Helix-turn-helix domain-containing protein n=1 Tax=Glaciecola siphonariae TaxID=521012 RepID=A0ABV9LZG5_9ALTE